MTLSDNEPLKTALFIAGITRAELAKKTGLALSTIHLLACRAYFSKSAAWKIEKALGMPVWSSDKDFLFKKKICDALRFDPWLTPKAMLIAKAQALKLRGRGEAQRKKETMIDLIVSNRLLFETGFDKSTATTSAGNAGRKDPVDEETNRSIS